MMNEERFVREVTDMRDMLYRLSVSYLHHDQDAQDAVSQAIENAWRHRGRVEPEAFRPWLTRIVINQCKSILRRRRRVVLSDRMELYAGMTPPPDLALWDALARLPDKLRTPLLLHHMEGFSVDEVARALHVPGTTVRSRMYRARAALRAGLEEKEGSRQ